MKYNIELNEDMSQLTKILAKENDMTPSELVVSLLLEYAKKVIQ
jgi:hypothetical protein